MSEDKTILNHFANYEDKWQELTVCGTNIRKMTRHDLELVAAFAADQYLHNNYAIVERAKKTDEQLVEAMAEAAWKSRERIFTWVQICPKFQDECRRAMRAALAVVRSAS